MKAKCPAVTPFRFTLIILYIICTAWVYALYTRSVIFRHNFQRSFLYQRIKGWKWVAMDNFTNFPQIWREDIDIKTWEEFKKHSTALKKATADASTQIAQHNSPTEDKWSAKDHKDPDQPTAGIQINKAHFNQTEPKPSPIPPSDQRALTVIPVKFKKNFKMMPYWELNDVYQRGEEAFQTVCAESLHKSKNEDFQKAFIPNIKMYLYQNQLNLSEWNRLSHFNNPFGFMEYNYTDIKSAVDLILKPNITQLLPLPANESCIRCAVVANGGILNGSKMGKEIDSHTYVFRMNGAVIEGHEEDVGNRTSVYVHTSFSLITSLIAYKKYGFKNVPNDEGIKFVMIPEGLRDFIFLKDLLNRNADPNGDLKKKKRAWAYYGGRFDESRFYVLHPDFLRYIRNRFMTSKQQNGTYWAMYRPTNGAFTLFLALHVCDIVDAYGFITENHKSFSNYYYENKKTNVIFFINHDYNLEIKLWKKLHDAKLIRLYQREGGQT